MLKRHFTSAIAPLLLMLAAGFACYHSAGTSAGLFIGTIVFFAVVVPPIASSETTLSGIACMMAGALIGAGVIWCIASLNDFYLTTGQLARCLLVACALAIALAGLVRLLIRLRLPPTASATITILLALLWLTWPIWLSHHLSGHGKLVDVLTRPHPLLTVDGVLNGQPWTEHEVMYNRLTVLNQDVPYERPDSVFWCVLVHMAAGAAALGLGALPRRGPQHDAGFAALERIA